MTELQTVLISVAGALALSFIAGVAFGVWMTLRTMRQARREFRKAREEETTNDNWKFRPLNERERDNFDPSKQPEFPMGDSAGEKPPTALMISHTDTDSFERSSP